MKDKQNIINKIDELEIFLLADLPSKVFPMERIFDETTFREDFFKTKDEIEKYIEEHFRILREQIKKEKIKNETWRI